MVHEAHEVERKVITILKVLRDSKEPVGARLIARKLLDHGIGLTERAVRYHLKLMDERGLTRLVGRDGRLITQRGIAELDSALVKDKVGFAFSKIELLAFRTNFNFETRSGTIPINVSFFNKNDFRKALDAMKPVFKAGICVSDLVAVAGQGEHLGEVIVPEGRIGLATVCSIVINGTLLKAGVPMGSRFGGLLQMQNGQPFRFVELIHYAGSSLDPSVVFIKGKMTSVTEVARHGNGRILANFREIPAACRQLTEEVVSKLKAADLGGVLLIGETSEPVCQTEVELNRIGMVLLGGLNPVAAAVEAGIEVENRAMSTVMEYRDLVKVWSI
ncbi:MAG: NrpR regulatory domain-containing protein [Dehalococcoidia bacterium]|nr:NrpR regulatory domain-containing protein [Dehalococcoidia bacterium]